MSEFIEHSKDPWGTAAVTEHFGGNRSHSSINGNVSRTPGGTSAWNNSAGDVSFNAPGQNLPMGRGVNQITPDQAGHRTTQDPFQLADGFPGN